MFLPYCPALMSTLMSQFKMSTFALAKFYSFRTFLKNVYIPVLMLEFSKQLKMFPAF